MRSLHTYFFLVICSVVYCQQMSIEGDLDLNANQIKNLGNPISDQDAVTKSYVDLLEKRIQDLEFDVRFLLGADSISDIEGNYYKIVKIGEQYWMAENLKTTKYNDGTDIPLILDDSTWNWTKRHGFSYYDHNPDSIDAYYGPRYNSFVGVDTNQLKVCPSGWKIPSKSDWLELMDFLENNGFGYGGSGDDIGKALASKTGWVVTPQHHSGLVGDYPEENNSSGFNGFPGGKREVFGYFEKLTAVGYWWSSTIEAAAVWAYDLPFSHDKGYLQVQPRNAGLSIRCIKN